MVITQKLIAERKKNLTLQLQYNSIKKSLIIAVSHPAEPGGGPEAEAHSGAKEESDPGGQRSRGTLPGTYRDLFIVAVSDPEYSGSSVSKSPDPYSVL